MVERRFAYSHAEMVVNKQYAVLDSHKFDEVVSGIYIIQDVSTDRCYVGASKNVAARWATHRNDLMNGNGHSEIKNDFVARRENFVFVLIENCTIDQLAERELYWVIEHESLSSEWGYNGKRPTYRILPPYPARIRVPPA